MKRYSIATDSQSFDPAIVDNKTGLVACFETADGLERIAQRMNGRGYEPWAWEKMPNPRTVAAARNVAAADKRREAKAAKTQIERGWKND